MPWQQYKQSAREELTGYLSENEWGHVGFSSRLRTARGATQPGTIYLRRAGGQQNGIKEALLYTRDGLIIPAFAAESPSSRSDLNTIVYDEIYRRKPNTVMGLRSQVDAVERAIGATPHASVTYHVMTITKSPRVTPSCDGIVCKRAKPRDAGLLYPLQRGYELEEVLLDPGSFNKSSCYLRLQKNLRRDLVFYAVKDGRAVAKAGTNAIGFSFAQLGGVFTVEEYRNLGYGEYVLTVLLAGIFRTHMGASLFVKKANRAAITLYNKLGFDIIDEYKITYYR